MKVLPPKVTGTRDARLPRGSARRSRAKYAYIAAAVAVIVVASTLVFYLRPRPAPVIVTEPLVRKTLITVGTASGTVNPQDTINVGTQVSGTIETIAADYNDRVHKGQVLARLAPPLFQAALDTANGSLAQARAQWQAAGENARGANSTRLAAFENAAAGVANAHVVQTALVSADATVDKARAALLLARQTRTRDRSLLAAGFIAQSQDDADSSNEVAAVSALSSAVTSARQARMQSSAARSQAAAGNAAGAASAAQANAFERTAVADLAAIHAAQAQVQAATINLAHTIITSPVDGTVIARNVSIGQTVAASFQTPTLYTIAKNLAEMEIDLAVGEPDIGAVHIGQRVDFTVLAYPDHIFHGKISQVRYNPTTIQNVVTYDTVVYENNADGRLRPGMTASASIEEARADNALVVSLAALNFHVTTREPQPAASGGLRAAPRSAWGNTGAPQVAAIAPGSLAQVTVIENATPRTVPVRVILLSGNQAAIEPIGQPLAPGSRVAVSVSAQR